VRKPGGTAVDGR